MLNLNLASGNVRIDDHVNVDINPDLADIQCDLKKFPYPFEDCTVDHIVAHHFVEHLYADENMRFMDECWRILKDGCELELIFPRWDSEFAWVDPTHVRAVHPEQYEYWKRGHGHRYVTKFWRVLVNTWQSGKAHKDFQVVILTPDR